jgi:CNT family concentrative nucleoside transporter
MIPETEPVNQEVTVPEDKLGSNLLDAISKGTVDGLKLAVNVGVMLLVFIALIEMLNFFFGSMIGEWTGLNEVVASATGGRYNTLSLQYLFGLAFSPLAWLLGVPIEDSVIIGQLLGEKTIINEFVAYASLGTAKTAGLIVNYKSLIIATYALCGFANFASIGIQIGGIGALAPNQWETLSRLGIRALIGGTIAAFMTASIAGMLSGW